MVSIRSEFEWYPAISATTRSWQLLALDPSPNNQIRGTSTTLDHIPSETSIGKQTTDQPTEQANRESGAGSRDLTWGTNIRGESERPGLPGGDPAPPPPPTTPTEHARGTWLAPPLPYGGKPRSDERTNESPPPSSTSAPSPSTAAASSSRPLALPMPPPPTPRGGEEAAKLRRCHQGGPGAAWKGRRRREDGGCAGLFLIRPSTLLVIKRVPLPGAREAWRHTCTRCSWASHHCLAGPRLSCCSVVQEDLVLGSKARARVDVRVTWTRAGSRLARWG
jgi:hypothetical protein